jgi:hypothetical protein
LEEAGQRAEAIGLVGQSIVEEEQVARATPVAEITEL